MGSVAKKSAPSAFKAKPPSKAPVPAMKCLLDMDLLIDMSFCLLTQDNSFGVYLSLWKTYFHRAPKICCKLLRYLVYPAYYYLLCNSKCFKNTAGLRQILRLFVWSDARSERMIKHAGKETIEMSDFVKPGSVVRQIWGNPDTILFIFAGASAEFALNKAVDWLYFTGKLPADPIGRLFSTVEYARRIVFSGEQEALGAIDQITGIHKNVEAKRGMVIPDWAYRDVLYMLIDYSMRAFELLERKLSSSEKEELFRVFNAVGLRMGIPGLPHDFEEWQNSRRHHLNANLVCSDFTLDLYKQYRNHLGPVRYVLLKQVQVMLVPQEVRRLLPFHNWQVLSAVLPVYKLFRLLNLDDLTKEILLPKKFKAQVRTLKTV